MKIQEHKDKIKATRKATTERRLFQQICSCELKVDKSKLSRHQSWFLNNLFLESKWYWNHVVQFLNEDGKLKDFNVYIKEVNGLDKDKNKVVKKLSLPAQVKNGLYQNMLTALKSLSTKGKKSKVGRLKFQKEINSIPLNNQSFKLIRNQLKINNLRRFPIIVNGVEQIPIDAELANSNLIRKHGDFFFHLTYYMPKQPIQLNGKSIGLDFGIKNTVTTSDGDKFDIKVPIPKKIKRLHKSLSMKQKGSKNRFKARIKLQKAYCHYSNKKRHQANQIFHFIRQFSWVAIQNDFVAGWQRIWGKKVSESSVGYLMAKTKKLPQVHIVSRWFPSTKLCPQCGCLNEINLSDRIFRCDCGYQEDRDVKSAKAILVESLYNIPTISREFKPVEEPAYTITARGLWQVDPMKQEASLVNNN